MVIKQYERCELVDIFPAELLCMCTCLAMPSVRFLKIFIQGPWVQILGSQHGEQSHYPWHIKTERTSPRWCHRHHHLPWKNPSRNRWGPGSGFVLICGPRIVRQNWSECGSTWIVLCCEFTSVFCNAGASGSNIGEYYNFKIYLFNSVMLVGLHLQWL